MIDTFTKIKYKLLNDFYIQSCLASIGYMILMILLYFIPLIETSSHEYLNYKYLLFFALLINLIKLLFSASKIFSINEVSNWHLKSHLALVVFNSIALSMFFTYTIIFVPHFHNEFWFIFFIINVINTASAFSVVISPITVFLFMGILGLIPPITLFIVRFDNFNFIDKNTILLLIFSSIYFLFLVLRARAHQKTVFKLYKYEEEIAIQAALATEAMKLAALGEMAGGIAHEINNPLAILYLHAKKINDHILENSNVVADDALKRFAKIFESIKRIEQILNGLKTYSQSKRADRRSFVKMDISEAVDIAKGLIISKLNEKKIAFETNYHHQDVKIFSNKSEMSQVILHLLNNAFEALLESSNGIIALDTYSVDDYLHICISDNGTGISKEVAKKLFIPFFSTKNSREHHGIGLSTSFAIIEAHGGELKYEADLKKGMTSFLIKLPIYSE